jgi:hypothetical protein
VDGTDRRRGAFKFRRRKGKEGFGIPYHFSGKCVLTNFGVLKT